MWYAELIPQSPKCGLGHARPALYPRQPVCDPSLMGQGSTPPELSSAPPEKPSVFSRELTDATVTEGEDLTLVCETTAPDSPVCWTKDGKTLRPSARCQLSQEGHQAQLVIKGTTVQDGGRYKCEAGGSWSSSIVRVHGEFLGSCPSLCVGEPVACPGACPGVCCFGRVDHLPPVSPDQQRLTCFIPMSCFLTSLCPLLLAWFISKCLSIDHMTNTMDPKTS